MITGNIIMVIALFLLSSSFFTGDTQKFILIMAGIVLFFCGFEIGFTLFRVIPFEGIGPLFFVHVSEIFPEKVRGRLASSIIGVQWLFNFLLSLTFDLLLNIIKDRELKSPSNTFDIHSQRYYVFHFYRHHNRDDVVLRIRYDRDEEQGLDWDPGFFWYSNPQKEEFQNQRKKVF